LLSIPGDVHNSKGNVFVVTAYDDTGYGPLYSINPDGSINWTYNVDFELWTSPGIDNNGTIYVGGEELRAINSDGTLKWSFKHWTPGGGYVRYHSPPVISKDGVVYIVKRSSPYSLYAIFPGDPVTFKRFEIEMGGYTSPIAGEPMLGSDGTIYISTEFSPSTLIALDSNLTENWRIEGAHGLIGVDRTIYGYTTQEAERVLTGLNPSGDIIWRSKLKENIFAIGNDGTIYAYGSAYVNFEWKYYLLAANPDGTQKWTSDFIGFFSGFTLSRDGIIYGLSYDGYLNSFYSNSNGIAETPWPMYRHDPQHTGQAGSTSGTPLQNRTAIWNTLLLLSE
jgi:hypothetical protein